MYLLSKLANQYIVRYILKFLSQIMSRQSELDCLLKLSSIIEVMSEVWNYDRMTPNKKTSKIHPRIQDKPQVDYDKVK